MREGTMITYPEALNLLLADVPLAKTETVNLEHSLARTCAKSIFSTEAMPSFANSAMDGFAVQTKAVADCSAEKPVYLNVIATIAAGDAISHTPSCAFDTCEIMTGAIVPNGFDAVIPIEAIKIIDSNRIEINQIMKPGQNIRYPGEDFQINDLVLSKGQTIEPKHIMILASLGITEIEVYKPIKVVILSTGNELVSIDEKQLKLGQIRHSNGIYAEHLIKSLGYDATFIGCFADDFDLVKSEISKIVNSENKPDVIITTGAVSAGKWDFIPNLLRELHAEILFHKVAIRPGKPILAAKLSHDIYFLGLPGNPVSTAVGLRFFAIPLLGKLSNKPCDKIISAKLKSSIQKKHDLHTFYKAYFEINSEGECTVDILSGQESFKMQPLLAANCWAILQEQKDYQQHELVKVYIGV
ncbi:MAG: molybdopterin molybdotransferase MoeA [Gammaproteobacteria bacterium]|jgi:molybdopterin molybdotransferase